MKKVLLSLLLMITMIFTLSSCSQLEALMPYIEELLGDYIDIGSNKTYVDFTRAEKALIEERIGRDIPFAPNNESTSPKLHFFLIIRLCVSGYQAHLGSER